MVRAVRLLAAGEVLQEALGVTPRPIARMQYETVCAAVRARIDEATFEAAWTEGRAMTLEQTITYALDQDTTTD